jgi:hypothetical protein
MEAHARNCLRSPMGVGSDRRHRRPSVEKKRREKIEII